MKILLTLIFVAIGLSMIAYPMTQDYNEPVEAIVMPEPIPTMSEPVIEPTATIEPTPEPTVTPSPTPTSTPRPTATPSPTPYPKPSYCFTCTNTWENRLNNRTSTGELVLLIECFDSQPLQNRSQVQAFMAYDTSHGDNWTCGHYAREVHNNAEANGIQVYLVGIQFREFTHAILMFPTIDDGNVYVDPQGADKWAYIPDDWNSYSIEFMSHVNTFTEGIITQPYGILSIINY